MAYASIPLEHLRAVRDDILSEYLETQHNYWPGIEHDYAAAFGVPPVTDHPTPEVSCLAYYGTHTDYGVKIPVGCPPFSIHYDGLVFSLVVPLPPGAASKPIVDDFDAIGQRMRELKGKP